jgi:BCD family chlorophyll transporter-like MFS transporter
MTVPGRVGLFMGAWGMANALARGAGTMLSGVVRDLVTGLTQHPLGGYAAVFTLEALMLAGSLALLRGVDAGVFRRSTRANVVERMALAND